LNFFDMELAEADMAPKIAASAVREDLRLTRLSKLCLALPETARTVRGDHADFRVRGMVFAYFLDDHHGDGIVSVCCKSELGEHIDRARREPQRFYLPAYIGARGWFGLRLDRGKVNWNEVQNIVELSYRLVAPKTLVRKLDAPPAEAKPRKRITKAKTAVGVETA
jgi:predicted DNA-binding protein (MmcQ/YjbR family)